MGKAIKVIQNGISTILPNNAATIARLEGFNHINSKSRFYEKEHYTIIYDVSPEEEQTIFPVRVHRAAVPAGPSLEDRFLESEKRNQELQAQMVELLKLQAGIKPAAESESISDPTVRKAGRPPKTQENG